MLTLPQHLIPSVAWLTSDRLLKRILLSDKGEIKNTNQTLIQAMFDYQGLVGTPLRNEDIQAAERHWHDAAKHIAPSNYSQHQQYLLVLSEHFLEWRGQCFEVKPKKLTKWLSLGSSLDLSWVIAQAYAHAMSNNLIATPEVISSILTHQCPIALPKSMPYEAYADNHVHMGGHGHTNVSMVDIALNLAPSRANTAAKWPRRPEYALYESGLLEKSSLPKLVNALSMRLCNEVLGAQSTPNIELETLDISPVSDIQPFLASSNMSDLSERQFLLQANNEQARNTSRWILLCCSLLAFENKQSNNLHYSNQLLAFIRTSNILRNYMVVSGVGLGQFVEFFGFKLRKTAKGDTGGTTDSENVYREFRIAPDKIAKGHKKKNTFSLKVNGLENIIERLENTITLDNIHFVLHFSRSFSAKTKAADKPWMDYRKALIEQAKKLQQFHSSVTFSDRPHPNSSLENPQPAGFDLRALVRGYDVAGNENELPIEVFAPVLRMLRSGKQHNPSALGKRLPSPFLTVHSGEDFSHILSGLRAIDETVTFCDFREGDRLGHALALGLDVRTWASRQQTVYMRVSEHLDNLIWCHYQALHISEKTSQFYNITSLLEQKIQYWSNYVGLEHYTINELYQGWKLRRNCPRAMMLSNTQTPSIWQEWLPDLGFINSAVGEKAKEVWDWYVHHDKLKTASSSIDKRDEIVAIHLSEDSESCLSGYPQPLHDNISLGEMKLMEAIQDYLMEKYSAMGIIIEACPTSNIYIGRFKEYQEHPIFRWNPPNLHWIAEGEKWNQYGLRRGAINVCINTDDSALMPTTIANEHRVIRDVAIDHYRVGRQQAEDWINRIREYGIRIFQENHVEPT